MNAVLVIDMLRGFLEPDCPLYCGDPARRIILPIQKLLEKELAAGSKVFYLCDNHDPDDLEFRMFPPHCVAGTGEAEVIPELAKFSGKIIPKKRYSAFYGTDLAERLEKLKPDKIIVCGVCTDICVCHTVADARNRDYSVEVPVDCVASFDEQAHRYALEHLQNVLGAQLTHVPPEVKFRPSPEVLSGDTADIYFRRTIDILEKEGVNPVATMEVFPDRDGIFCGIEEVQALLLDVLPVNHREVWALPETSSMTAKEVVLRITAPYRSYGLYETAIAGMLSHASGWITAARECVDAASGLPVISFGARHVHPSVAGVMDYAAVTGGCTGCSSITGARLAGIEPSGTMPHALILIVGDTVKATMMFDARTAPDVPRVSLVDTFMDEAEESLRVAEALRGNLQSVRLDTPFELGGVTPDLVKKVRSRLDGGGFKYVNIFVSGGITPERIAEFLRQGAPVDGFGVGSYISGAQPIDFTADIHEVDGRPVAKRGRSPGVTPNPRLQRIV
ncbi:MAG: nicotinate phosphoribosyltransferase [Dehalococcoidales bacterium]|nr:nicotinate phosphoribosyltransferase [Dehalococcoidales bacterium]